MSTWDRTTSDAGSHRARALRSPVGPTPTISQSTATTEVTPSKLPTTSGRAKSASSSLLSSSLSAAATLAAGFCRLKATGFEMADFSAAQLLLTTVPGAPAENCVSQFR